MSVKFFPSENPIIRVLGYIWACPTTIFGSSIGVLGLLSGGKVEKHRGCLEFHGGFVGWFLDKMCGGVTAMTLGHSILGQSSPDLEFVRDHEQVHVRQYERWGPFFVPAYLICSAYLWSRKRDAYRENPFEVEAYALSDPGND